MGSGKVVIEGLRNAGLKIEAHSTWFRHDTPDENWLDRAGESKWIVLMRDKKIGTRILELDALLDAGVKSFVLVSGQLSASENVTIIITALPKIIAMIVKNDFPFIAKVHRDGNVLLWRTKPLIHKGIQKKGTRE